MHIYDLRIHNIKHIDIEFYMVQYTNTNVMVEIIYYLFVKQHR